MEDNLSDAVEEDQEAMADDIEDGRRGGGRRTC